MQQLWMCDQYVFTYKGLGLSSLGGECGVGFGFFFNLLYWGVFLMCNVFSQRSDRTG